MSYDVAALKRALDRFAEQKTERELAHARTVRELNERYPRLAEIERDIASCGLMIVENVMKGGDAVEDNVARIKARVRALREERAAILRENRLPPDAADGRYACAACGDTGYVGSEMCACLRGIYREEQYAELAELFFKTFISALDVIYIFNFGNALCRKSCDDERRTCSEIGCCNGCAHKRTNALDNCDLSVNGDIRTHSAKLVNITETVVENALRYDARSLRKAKES